VEGKIRILPIPDVTMGNEFVYRVSFIPYDVSCGGAFPECRFFDNKKMDNLSALLKSLMVDSQRIDKVLKELPDLVIIEHMELPPEQLQEYGLMA
jgi:hypothetical protein